MITVDCPLCDAPAPYDESAGLLECPACEVALEVAETPAAPHLAAAA